MLVLGLCVVTLLGGVALLGAWRRSKARERVRLADEQERREAAEMIAYEAEYAAANPPEKADPALVLEWWDATTMPAVSRTRKEGGDDHDCR